MIMSAINMDFKVLAIAILISLFSSLSFGNEALAQSFLNEDIKVDKAVVFLCAKSNKPLECIGNAANQCQRIHKDGFDGGTTYGIATCLQHERKIWDSLLSLEEEDLNRYYAEQDIISFHSDISRLESFQQAQTSWRAHLKSECRLQLALNQEGTIRSIVASGCELSMVAKRLLFLKKLWNKDI